MIVLRDGSILEVSYIVGPEDVSELAWNIRAEDRKEIERYTGRTPQVALEQALMFSTYRRKAVINDKLVAIWGVVPWGRGHGSTLAMTTEMVDKYPREFMIGSRWAIREIGKEFPAHLEVDVDAEYGKAVRWLRWLGFKLQPIKVRGSVFYKAVLTPNAAKVA